MATTMSTRFVRLSERRFFSGVALLILLAVFVGFSRSFFLRPFFPEWPSPAEPIFYVHGAVATAWIMLLVVQTQLAARGRFETHRQLGLLGAALAVAMPVLGLWGSLVAAVRPTGFVGIPVPPLQFLVVPVFDIVLFSAFVGLAFAQRHVPQSHKRWMLLATINLLPAAIARWPGMAPLGPVGFFAFTDLFILALVGWDLHSRGRVHPVTLVGGALLIASQPLRLVVSGSDGWLAVARWLTGSIG